MYRIVGEEVIEGGVQYRVGYDSQAKTTGEGERLVRTKERVETKLSNRNGDDG
jgi:hypothetical protein